MRAGIALVLALSPLIVAGCAAERADGSAPYTTSAGPAQVKEDPAEVRNVIESFRPFAF